MAATWGDDADFLAPAMKRLESVDGDVEGVGIESSEPFVDKKSVDKRGSPFEAGKRAGKRERHEKAFAAGETARGALFVGHVTIDDVDREV